MNAPLRIAMAGLGTVGGGVAKALRDEGRSLSERAGRPLDLIAVSARDGKKKRNVEIAQVSFHPDSKTLADSSADVVVELIGGEDGPAFDLVQAALKNKKHVVTANKALLAKHGLKLAALAEESGVALKFEAAVAGGIPIVKALRESLIAYGVGAVHGILNGTCNYILTQMESTGRAFGDVLKDAQKLGYAEADPTLDIGGGDTAHKLSLLATLAFGTVPSVDGMEVQGIANITPDDIYFAREFGCRIKLVGRARMAKDGIAQSVGPVLVRAGTPLADVEGASNAILAEAGAAGPYFFEGRGAGEAPTASAVIADIMDIARGNIGPVFGRPVSTLRALPAAPLGQIASAYYLRFDVLDVPGVLAEIAARLAEAGVSIESMIQRGRAPGEAVSIVMITHETQAQNVERALQAIAASDKVRARPCMIPMESA